MNMTRAEIEAEITRLKEELRLVNDDINDCIREIPECRKADRQSRKILHMNIPGRDVFLDAETKINTRIYEKRRERDELKAKIEELKAQLRSQPHSPPRQKLEVDWPRMTGVVKWYNEQKNFGFIRVDGIPDVFVHRSALMESTSLREGDKVTFKRVQGPKGFNAVDVRYATE